MIQLFFNYIDQLPLVGSRIIRKRIRVTIEHLWLGAGSSGRGSVLRLSISGALQEENDEPELGLLVEVRSSKLLSERGGSYYVYCHKFVSSYEFQKFDRNFDSTIRDSSTPKQRSSISKNGRRSRSKIEYGKGRNEYLASSEEMILIKL
ncbi:hypothetical protein LINPERPRIM_LOCUS28247 [Linum perenne]